MIKKKKKPQSLLVIEARREHFVKLTSESFINISWASRCWESSVTSRAPSRSEVCSVLWPSAKYAHAENAHLQLLQD